MLLRCAVVAALFFMAGPARGVTLVRIGDAWKYMPGLFEPSADNQIWKTTGFDDSLWLTGRSGFSTVYVAAEATVMPNSLPPYSSAYFRRTFVVDDPKDIEWLTLRIDYADGFIAYLNGREIARRNVDGPPGSAALFNQLASMFHYRGEPVELDVTAGTNALVAGSNTFALQLHAARRDNPGLSVSAELHANANRSPFLQNMSSNQVQVIWKTPIPADTRLRYGKTNGPVLTLLDAARTTTHIVTLTNLEPDTTYEYQASSAAGGAPALERPNRFHTFKPAGPLTFIAFGDGGWNSLAQYQIAEVMSEAKPDLVLEAGDIVYPSFTSALADLRCFSPYQPQMAQTPYFFALGNHDLYSGVFDYLEAFYLPTNSVSLAQHAAEGTSPEHYYSFDHGDAHFTVLFVPFISQHRLSTGDPQFQWLTNDLAQTPKPWKVVLWHVPMSSSSAHRFDDYDFTGTADRLEIRDVLLPALTRYGVQLVLCGHEHGYERFNPTNGVHSITTAGGGAVLYGFSELDEASAFFEVRYNCVKVQIQGDTLRAEAFGADGNVFDSFTIQRQLPASAIYAAAWHTPVAPSDAASDGAGNILGQTFDFLGPPIASLSGRFSNLGQAFVNNDASRLYIGLKEVALHRANTLFLFIESPRLNGLTDLLEVGNGVVDPDDQGADGLDFLTNLSFTNFHPSVGCILGDEYADGQFRSFARTNLALNTGQGVFKLDARLTDLGGARVQQFHLSPQLSRGRYWPNAAYIEVAIPLAELGGLQPGDLIRIGAVVGGPEFNPAVGSRALDSGFLGARMSGYGTNSVVLEGVAVRLALDPDADSDADGATNFQEAQSGTDPLDANSVFRLDFQLTAGRKVRLSFAALPGRKYHLQSSETFAGFADMENADFPVNTIATNVSYDLELDNPLRRERLFRVRLSP